MDGPIWIQIKARLAALLAICTHKSIGKTASKDQTHAP